MNVEKPIIIVGAGRSGSTIFHELLSEHPSVAWLPEIRDYLPTSPGVNKLLVATTRYPVVGWPLKRLFRPGERYDIWEQYYRGFGVPFRDLEPGDVTERARERTRRGMEEFLTTRRNRLMVKITGWPRIGFLHKIFADAKFIHVVRDGRAVLNSYLNVRFWWGWRGTNNWRFGELPPDLEEEWAQYEKSFVALAAIQWKIVTDAVERAKEHVDADDYLQVRYEDLCADPIGVLRQAVEFSDLPWSNGFEQSTQRYSLRNTNDKWQQDLTSEQQAVAEELLQDHLERYGYNLTSKE